MKDNTVARLQSTRVQTPLSLSIECNVLRKSLSGDSQNIPCATLKRKGSWVIFIYLWEKIDIQGADNKLGQFESRYLDIG
jgi:hypothetical protein